MIAAMALYLGWGSCPSSFAQTSAEPPAAAPRLPAHRAWSARLPASPRTSGALDGRRVYLPFAGQLIALDRATGTTAWTADLDVRWPPVVVGGSLWVATASELVELDVATGRPRHGARLAAALSAPVSVGLPFLFLATTDGAISALDTGSRTIRWRVSTGGNVSSTSAGTASDMVIVALDDARVLALAAADGRLIWSRALTGLLAAPVASAGRVFIGSSDNAFFALDATDGQVVWRWSTGADVVGAAADQRTVYVVSRDHVVLALDTGSGNQRWRRVSPTRPVAEPTLHRDLILVTGLQPLLAAYARSDGMPSGALEHAGDIDPAARLVGPPLVEPAADGEGAVMVVVTRDGQVLGLRPSADADPPAASP